MSEGITNVEIQRFTEEDGDDLLVNFTGVFASNNINGFIIFHSLSKERDDKYPLMNSNTDRSYETRTH